MERADVRPVHVRAPRIAFMPRDPGQVWGGTWLAVAPRVVWLFALISASLWAAGVGLAQAQAPARAPAAPSAAASTSWLQASLGVSLPVPRGERRDGGVDFGAAYGFRRGRFRIGAETRYTFLGGFDQITQVYRVSEPSYRLDLGPAFAAEVLACGSFSLQLGARGLFSRSGTYRHSGALLGSWECNTDGCTSNGEPSYRVAFVAFYGFSAALDLIAVFPGVFVRVSGLRTRWFGGHEVDPPKVQHWLQLAVGFSY
jgi:hypothetical protein